VTDTTAPDSESAIVKILERAPRRARFVSELAQQLRRAKLGVTSLESDLGKLEASGRVLVREQFCADPHLEGTDLRIVALVWPAPGGATAVDDPQARAVADIEAVWDRWLADYLSNHRCG
jgi:hypothetical protein